MARYKEAEPQFLGVFCNGPHPAKAAQLQKESDAKGVLAHFYRLTKDQQLIVAAATTQMVKNNERERSV